MLDILFSSSIFCSLITAYLLFFKTEEYQQFSGRILGFSMLFYSWCALAYLLITSGWILEIPFFYKTAAPINYLIPPLGYLYVKSVLNNENKFHKHDWWHLIPFIFFAINYLPVYTMGQTDKMQLLRMVLNNSLTIQKVKEGFLPEYVHILAKTLQSIIYLIFQWKLLIEFRLNLISPKFEMHTTHVIRWLKIFNWSFSLVLFSTLSSYIFILSSPANTLFIITICTLFIALGYLVLSSFLLLNPEVLFGLPYALIAQKAASITISKSKKEALADSKDYEKEISRLEKYFADQRPYLQKTLNINEVAIGVGIPARDLSFILNQHFNQRFTDFVNRYRIEYVIQQIKAGFCDKYTLETLANQAGFTSKTTFNTAFKKHTQLTPSEFIAQQEPHL